MMLGQCSCVWQTVLRNAANSSSKDSVIVRTAVVHHIESCVFTAATWFPVDVCACSPAAAATERLERRQLGYLLARQGVQLNLEEGAAAVEVRACFAVVRSHRSPLAKLKASSVLCSSCSKVADSSRHSSGAFSTATDMIIQQLR